MLQVVCGENFVAEPLEIGPEFIYSEKAVNII